MFYAFQSRDTDIIGALVDHQNLQNDLATLFGVIAVQLPQAVRLRGTESLARRFVRRSFARPATGAPP